MRKWVELSLDERVTKLNRMFSGAKCTKSTQWTRMKKAGVTWKVIKWQKKMKRDFEKDEKQYQDCKRLLDQATAEGLDIQWIDQAVFSKGSGHDRAFAPKHRNLRLSKE